MVGFVLLLQRGKRTRGARWFWLWDGLFSFYCWEGLCLSLYSLLSFGL